MTQIEPQAIEPLERSTEIVPKNARARILGMQLKQSVKISLKTSKTRI